MAVAVPWLILVAFAVASADATTPNGATFPSATPAPAGAQPGASDPIPPPLDKITKCMVDSARAQRGVLSAERGVAVQDGVAYVYVDYRYRFDDGRVGIAHYSRLRDQTPLQDWRGMHVEKPWVLFVSELLGAFPMCDVDRHGHRDCANVRAWDRARPQPIPGWGTKAVGSAWEKTCLVAASSFTF